MTQFRGSSWCGLCVAGLLSVLLAGTRAHAQVAEAAYSNRIGIWGMEGRISFFRESTRDVRALMQRMPEIALQRSRPVSLGAPEASTLQLSGLRAELSGSAFGLDWRGGYMLRGLQDRWAFDRFGPGQQSEIERAVPTHNLVLQAGTFWQGAAIDATMRAGSATHRPAWGPEGNLAGWLAVPAQVSLDLGATWSYGRLGRVELRGENLASSGIAAGWTPLLDRRVTLSFARRF